jgi:protein-L-isoaspartate(D-aspartate) O-methyltransferase
MGMDENERRRQDLQRHLALTRAEMLARLRAGGVTDERVLRAMATVPREEFVLPEYIEEAYADRALPIGEGQTISQPLMVGLIVQALQLREGDEVLDVGTGSGYQAAVIAACGAKVVSIERIPALAAAAAERLKRLGYDVEVLVGDGTLGVPGRRFDAIAVAAASPWPPPRALLESLRDGGRLVIPITGGVGGRLPIDGEELIRFTRIGEEHPHYRLDDLGPCRFVPLIGSAGYREE